MKKITYISLCSAVLFIVSILVLFAYVSPLLTNYKNSDLISTYNLINSNQVYLGISLFVFAMMITFISATIIILSIQGQSSLYSIFYCLSFTSSTIISMLLVVAVIEQVSNYIVGHLDIQVIAVLAVTLLIIQLISLVMDSMFFLERIQTDFIFNLQPVMMMAMTAIINSIFNIVALFSSAKMIYNVFSIFALLSFSVLAAAVIEWYITGHKLLALMTAIFLVLGIIFRLLSINYYGFILLGYIIAVHLMMQHRGVKNED